MKDSKKNSKFYDWNILEEKYNKILKEKINNFIYHLNSFRSDRISLEIIGKHLIFRKKDKFKISDLANLNIVSNNRISVIVTKLGFENVIIDAIITNFNFSLIEKKDKFHLLEISPMNLEIKKEITKKIQDFSEKERSEFRNIRNNVRNFIKNNSSSSDERIKLFKKYDNLFELFNNKISSLEKEKIIQINS